MTNITFKQLRYFEALARHRHFGRAAEACGISQPALSVQIKELEAMLGAVLVERGARQVGLTRLGDALFERSRRILTEVGELGDLARSASGPFTGQLRFGLIPTIAPYLLVPVISALATRMPGLELHPRETVTRTLIADLLDAQLDAAIVALPISEPALEEYALFEEDFVLVRPQSEANAPVPGPDKLQQMRLLLLEEGHCFRDQALSYCAITDAPPRTLMEGSSLATLVQMVGAGLGVTLIPEMAVPLETRLAPVSVARFPTPAPARRIGMVWRKTNPLAEKLMEVAEVVREVGASK
jgi:LysR family transcriptional regulator, hydrogen peroxide-inducible genes activator